VLTAREFRLLAALARAPGRVLSREELVARAFGDDFDGFDRTVDAHVAHLRKKIEDDPGVADAHRHRLRRRLPPRRAARAVTLRLRLFLMGALVAAVAAAAVGLVARGRVEGEFRQFLEHDDLLAFQRVTREVSARLASGEPRPEAVRAFERAAAGQRRPIAWLAANGRVIAASPALRNATIRVAGSGRVSVTRKDGARNENFVWIGLPRAALPDSAGELVLFPALDASPAGPGAAFQGGVQKGLVHAALFGLLAALVASLFLGRAIARSLEELTRAARAVALGDRTRRVAVRGNDEIAKLARASMRWSSRSSAARRCARTSWPTSLTSCARR
jgi:HAMP domain-containing protein